MNNYYGPSYTGEEDYVITTGLYTPYINGNTMYASLSSMNSGPSLHPSHRYFQ